MWCSKRGTAWGLGALLCLGALSLGGCGFHPLYGARDARQTALLDAVVVDVIEGRKGQVLRTLLTQSFTPYGVPAAPLYRLKITLRDQTSDMGILKDLTASRAQYQVSADVVIIEAGTGKRVYETTLQAAVSYNLLSEADFSTLVARESAETAAVRELAPQIEQVVSIFLDYDESQGAS